MSSGPQINFKLHKNSLKMGGLGGTTQMGGEGGTTQIPDSKNKNEQQGS